MIRNLQTRAAACHGASKLPSRSLFIPSTYRSHNHNPNEGVDTKHEAPQHEKVKEPKAPKKTLAQLDEEMRAAMEGRSGDGGLAGAELEGGKAVSMKRGVRDNMFRYI